MTFGLPYTQRGLLFLLAVLCLPVLACTPGPDSALDGTEPVSISLVSLWPQVEDAQELQPTHELSPTVIRFDDHSVKTNAVSGIEGLQIESGALTGRVTGEPAVLRIDLPEPVGIDDHLWELEVTLATDGGRQVAFLPLPPENPPPTQALLGPPIPVWSVTTPLVPGESATTYSLELEKIPTLGVPLAESHFSTLLIRFFGPGLGSFSIESIRFVFRNDYLRSIRSGPGWHGLGGVYRESLLTRTAETLTFPVDLPPRAFLDLAVGSAETAGLGFRVALTGADDETTTLEEVTLKETGSWHPLRIDLSDWAGETVRLHLETAGGEAREGLALWGVPTVRKSIDPDLRERPQAVVLFLADTLRRDHLEAWGHGRETAPNMTALARDGVRFDDVIAQATWTKSSVPSILTSLYPSTSGVTDLDSRVAAGETTIAEIFRQAGYATFATASIPFTGRLTNLHQGVEVMYEYTANESHGKDYEVKSSKAWVNAYIEWLDDRRDVPTFALIHAMDPHSPFEPPEPYDVLFASADDAVRFAEEAEQVRPHIESPGMQRFLMPNREELETAGVDPEFFIAHELAWYDGSIRHMDDHLGRMMDRLDELGLHDDALVAVVSDHGEEFLEHGQQWHGLTVYGEVANVPMLVWGEGVPRGVTVEQTVQTIDLLPTLAHLAGLEIPKRAQGRSLVPLFAGDGAGRTMPAFTERHLQRFDEPGSYASFSIVDEGWKLIWNVDAPEGVPKYELYDHREDPLNQSDVAAGHPEKVNRLSEKLRRWKAWAEAQQLDEEAATSDMSAEELEQLRSLGYID